MFLTNLCFPPQGSFGDCFVLTGAINWYSERCNLLFLPVSTQKPGLLETVTCLFKDNKKVVVISFSHPYFEDLNVFVKENGLSLISAFPFKAFSANDISMIPLWDEQCYTILDLPFSLRYSYFKLPNIEKESKDLYNNVVKNPRYILVSQKLKNSETTIDLKIESSDRQVIELTEELCENMLYFSELIYNAEEIHCVPSGIFCLVDSLNKKTNAKLFYHDIRKETVMRINNNWNDNRWNIVNYVSKL